MADADIADMAGTTNGTAVITIAADATATVFTAAAIGIMVCIYSATCCTD